MRMVFGYFIWETIPQAALDLEAHKLPAMRRNRVTSLEKNPHSIPLLTSLDPTFDDAPVLGLLHFAPTNSEVNFTLLHLDLVDNAALAQLARACHS